MEDHKSNAGRFNSSLTNSYRIEEAISNALKDHLESLIRETVRAENETLLSRHSGLKPLLSIKDVAKTLNCSVRTVETCIAEGAIKPLWIKGQRRFHPDTIAAYIRDREV